MLEEKDIGTVRLIQCNTCGVKTHHELKSVHKRTIFELDMENTPLESVNWWEEIRQGFWFCRGCDTTTLMEAYSDLEIESRDPKSAFNYKTLYPTRKKGTLAAKRFNKLDPQLIAIYREVITSYNTGLEILCAIGLRSLLEGICADKGLKEGNLFKRISGLKQFLPENIVENLHSFRFMGNDAAHELKGPGKLDLRLSIEVMEDLLNFLYELDYKSSRLARIREDNR